jgi:hypothetical protein
MINSLFSPKSGSGGLFLTGLAVASVEQADDGTVVVHVGSTSAPAAECPNCGARRHVTVTSLAHFRDIPKDGYRVVLAWRRRNFRCTACHEPSHETLPVLQERHRVTTRLIEWIWQEASKSTFMDVARRCGLSQRSVLRLFKGADRLGASRRELPFNLGLALVRVAGLRRPVLCDTANGAVIDVYRSIGKLEDHLANVAAHAPSTHRLALDLGLHVIGASFLNGLTVDRFFVPPQSAASHAGELMLRAASEAIAAHAEREGKTAKSRRVLFSRRREDLGRVGTRRLHAWSPEADAVECAYDLKERFLTLCQLWQRQQWLDWRKEALELPRKAGAGSTRIDYGEVIHLIDDHAEAIDRYQQQRRNFKEYEKTLKGLAKHAPSGTRSFPGSRAAVLQKFRGRRSGSAGDAEEAGAG